MQTEAHLTPPPEQRVPAWMDSYVAGNEGIRADGHHALIDLDVIRGFFWRQKWIIAGITAGVLLLGLVVTLLMQPKYTAAASVRVDPQTQTILEGQDASPILGSSDVSRYIATLASVIRSRAIAYIVVDKLKLASSEDFLGNAVVDRNMDPKALRELAVNKLQSELAIDAPMDERILTISYVSPNPQLATSIANAYVDAFLADDMRRNFEKNDYARNYLNTQINDTRAKLQLAERQAIAYARGNRIVGPALLGNNGDDTQNSNAAPQTITASNLAEVNSGYTEMRAKRIAAQERWLTVAKLDPKDLPEVQQNSTIQSLAADRAKAASQLAELQTRYGSTYPAVLELTAQIRAIDKQTAQIGKDIKATLEQDYKVAQNQEDALAGELRRISDATLDEQDRRVNFNQLEREAGALRTQLQTLLERYNQISAAANIQPGTITRLDSAIVPQSPSSPNLIKNMLIALVLGAGAAIGIAFLLDILDDRLRSFTDIERKMGQRPLGLTPYIVDLNIGESIGVLDEAYVSIRSSIQFVLPNRNHNVLQFTSSQAREGKTTTAVSLAQKFSQVGQKVLLIDADLRRPSINIHFETRRSKKGIVEVILGQCTLPEALLETSVPNMDVLPVGEIPGNAANVIASQQFQHFIETVRQAYDLVIIDSSPIIGIADAPLLSRYTDGVVFVVEANRAHFGQAKAALRRIEDAGANILGVVLTKYQAMMAGQSYGDQYEYYTYAMDSKDS